MNRCFHFSWVIPTSGIFGSPGIRMFNLEELDELFPEVVVHRHQQRAGPVCATGPGIVVVSLLNFRHSGRCVVAHLHGFNLRLPEDQMWSIFSHAFWPFEYLLLPSVHSNFGSFL